MILKCNACGAIFEIADEAELEIPFVKIKIPIKRAGIRGIEHPGCKGFYEPVKDGEHNGSEQEPKTS
jgi:hypothetical protein